jgi:hypothetical protein
MNRRKRRNDYSFWKDSNVDIVILNHDIISHVASMSRVSQSWTSINHLASDQFNHHSSSIQALTCSLRSRLMSRIEVNSQSFLMKNDLFDETFVLINCLLKDKILTITIINIDVIEYAFVNESIAQSFCEVLKIESVQLIKKRLVKVYNERKD